MVWNYRIMRREDISPYYGFVEAYYDKRGDKEPSSWTEGISAPVGETHSELIGDLAHFLVALTKPILGPDGKECEQALLLKDELQKWFEEQTGAPSK